MSGNPAAFRGHIPTNYDDGLGPVIFAGYAADMAQRAIAGVAPSRVLETAAGSGIVTRALRNALPTGAHLTATDLNVAMLDIARTKFHTDEGVEFHTTDATDLPFPNHSFDLMSCQFGVMFFPDKDKGYREAHRVLIPDGRYLFSVWDSHRHNPFGRIAHEVIGTFFQFDPPRFYEVPFGYHAIDLIKESLLGAGFDEISIDIIRQSRTITDFSSFARGIIFGNPVFDEIRQRGGASPSQVADAVIGRLRTEFPNGSMPVQAIVFEARTARS